MAWRVSSPRPFSVGVDAGEGAATSARASRIPATRRRIMRHHHSADRREPASRARRRRITRKTMSRFVAGIPGTRRVTHQKRSASYRDLRRTAVRTATATDDERSWLCRSRRVRPDFDGGRHLVWLCAGYRSIDGGGGGLPGRELVVVVADANSAFRSGVVGVLERETDIRAVPAATTEAVRLGRQAPAGRGAR